MTDTDITAEADTAIAEYVAMVKTNGTTQPVLDALADGETLEIAYEVEEYRFQSHGRNSDDESPERFDAIIDRIDSIVTLLA